MNKIVVSFILVSGLLLTTACTNNSKIKESSIIDLNSSSIINSDENSNSKNSNYTKSKSDNINKTKNIIKFPIILIPKDDKDEKDIKYLEVNEDITLEEKLDLIVNAISQECFNGLPIKVSVYNENIAKVELLENDNLSSRVSWKDDYLNDQMKEYTLNVILKNILQEEYKGNWIENIQLYYQGELISLN